MDTYLGACYDFNLEMTPTAIGSSGESIAKAILEYFPIFKVVFLGEKNPITDFYVETIVETDDGLKIQYPFLVQIKTTTSALDDLGRLSVSVPTEKYQSLCANPLPTYVGGIHLEDLSLFVKPAFDNNAHVNTIPPIMVLRMADKRDCASKLLQIQRDVITYWEKLGIHDYKQGFVSLIRLTVSL